MQKRVSRFRLLATCLVLCCAPTGAALSQSYPALSCFSAVRWKGESTPEVEVAGKWYELRALNGIAADRIIAHSKKAHEGRWKKRFEEDLVQLLHEMGQPPRARVTLELLDLEGGGAVTLRDVEMTKENRRRIWEAGRKRPEGRPAEVVSAPPEVLSREQVKRDLDALQEFLVTRYSYLELRKVDLNGGLERIEKACSPKVSRGELALQVGKLLSLFGDGHTRLNERLEEAVIEGALPFLVQESSGRLAAFPADRSDFLDPRCRFVKALDGVDVEKWIEAAAGTVARGSKQFVRWHSIRGLRHVQYLRRELKLPVGDKVAVTLTSEDQKTTRKLTLPVARRAPVYGAWPRTKSRKLDGSLGYLRIAEMESAEEFLEGLRRWMDRFKDTRGLVIDVRGNGGGSREALRTLFPYFMKPSEEPYVANAAVYRLGPGEEQIRAEGYLDDRFLYPMSAALWSSAERAAVESFTKSFKPEWKPEAEKFSEWHYLVLSPSSGKGTYHYDRPVVILMDTGCFSAADIFLTAFKGRPRITLVGTASGGGSGRARSFELPESRLKLQASTIASFQRSGRLLDGNGVEPDVRVEPAPTDFIGRTDKNNTDKQLDAAVELLKRR